MVDSPDLRAGDEDRDHTITLIREAFAEGRLDAGEFETRMTSAQSARTYGELAALVSDLPVQPPSAPVVVPASAGVASPTATSDEIDLDDEDTNIRKGWAAWAGVSLLVNVIWVGSWLSEGEPGYYWPIWVMGPWGAAMVIGTLNRRAERRRR
jgi:hypothetical protein